MLFAAAFLSLTLAPVQDPLPRGYRIPRVDLAGEVGRQVVVDREAGQYLGHPTTVLLEDGRTRIGHWVEGEEPYVVSVRFRLEELDERLR